MGHAPLQGILLFSCGSMALTNTPRYLRPGGSSSVVAPTTVCDYTAPRDMVLCNMYVYVNTVGSVGPIAITYTLWVAGAATTLEVVMDVAASTGSDTTHSVQVRKGDKIRLVVNKPGGLATSPTDVVVSLDTGLAAA